MEALPTLFDPGFIQVVVQGFVWDLLDSDLLDLDLLDLDLLDVVELDVVELDVAELFQSSEVECVVHPSRLQVSFIGVLVG